MKKLVTVCALALSVFAYPQNDHLGITVEEPQLNKVSIAVTVESAEDLKSTFKLEDLEDLLEMSNDKSAKFTLICRGELMSNGKPSSMSYSVERGDMSERDFLKMVKKIRKSAIKYYQNK